MNKNGGKLSHFPRCEQRSSLFFTRLCLKLYNYYFNLQYELPAEIKGGSQFVSINRALLKLPTLRFGFLFHTSAKFEFEQNSSVYISWYKITYIVMGKQEHRQVRHRRPGNTSRQGTQAVRAHHCKTLRPLQPHKLGCWKKLGRKPLTLPRISSPGTLFTYRNISYLVQYWLENLSIGPLYFKSRIHFCPMTGFTVALL